MTVVCFYNYLLFITQGGESNGHGRYIGILTLFFSRPLLPPLHHVE